MRTVRVELGLNKRWKRSSKSKKERVHQELVSLIQMNWITNCLSKSISITLRVMPFINKNKRNVLKDRIKLVHKQNGPSQLAARWWSRSTASMERSTIPLNRSTVLWNRSTVRWVRSPRPVHERPTGPLNGSMSRWGDVGERMPLTRGAIFVRVESEADFCSVLMQGCITYSWKFYGILAWSMNLI